MKLAFIGLGLIGGSIAKTIHRKSPETEIIAYDLNKSGLDLALEEGVISSASDEFSPDFFRGADVIFLCAPVHSNTAYLPLLKSVFTDDTILTDVGSVKGEINEIIEAADLGRWFVGGHPMAGTEKSGYENSSDRLVENAYYILTPSPLASSDKVEKMKELVLLMDAIPLVLTPALHDYATAAISHLPHVIAYSLVNLVKDVDDSDETMKLIAAGGFKDITRIASSSPEMWRQICLVNGSNISTLLERYIDSLSVMKDKIDNADSEYLYENFEKAKDYRDSFISASPGPIKKIYALHCDLIDESGAIATIATILASNGISIKNIGIVHNREFQDGALRVEFYTESEYDNAVSLLKKHRYVIYS